MNSGPNPVLRSNMSKGLILFAVVLTLLFLVGGGGGGSSLISISVERAQNTEKTMEEVARVDQKPLATKEDGSAEDAAESPKEDYSEPVETKNSVPANGDATKKSNTPAGNNPSTVGDDGEALHISPLPKLTKDQLMDRRDLYANIHVPTDYQGENLASIGGMRKLLHQGREKYWKRLQRQDQYGSHAERIFQKRGESVRTGAGKHVFTEPWNVANDHRLKNWGPEKRMGQKWFMEKIKLKLVQAQLKFLEADSPDTTLTRFVHVHGGHSAAAGHGNFLDESYTAVAEQALRPVLRKIGINYVGRNMAAGATSSADEVSLCSTAYFGYEMDILTWDYGMTDGKVLWKQELYTRRAAMRSQLPPLSDDINDVPSRPALIGVHTNPHAAKVFASAGAANMTVVIMAYPGGPLNAVPDTSAMKTQEEVDALPEMLRQFRCGAGYEKGGTCKSHKYNDIYCKERSHKASWHPGHRMHGLEGNLFAMGILESMEDAMDELAELEPKDESKEDAKERLTKLFWELNNAEQARFNEYVGRLARLRGGWMGGESAVSDVLTQQDIVHTPSFCHIAKLPTDMRYRGLLTENFELTTINPAVELTYDDGVQNTDAKMKPELQNPEPRQGEPLLITHLHNECPQRRTHIDNRDIFEVRSTDGWKSFTLPNDSQEKFYEDYNVKTGKGLIMLCWGPCAWGKCESTDVRPMNKKKDPNAGHLEMKVNGVVVTGYDGSGGGCHFMKHEGDPHSRLKWQPNEDGKFHITMRVADATVASYAKFSSFIFF